MLSLTNVQIVYDNTIEAVREASLTLGPGDRKSTRLNSSH